jgi:hypothetical protein
MRTHCSFGIVSKVKVFTVAANVEIFVHGRKGTIINAGAALPQPHITTRMQALSMSSVPSLNVKLIKKNVGLSDLCQSDW